MKAIQHCRSATVDRGIMFGSKLYIASPGCSPKVAHIPAEMTWASPIMRHDAMNPHIPFKKFVHPL